MLVARLRPLPTRSAATAAAAAASCDGPGGSGSSASPDASTLGAARPSPNPHTSSALPRPLPALLLLWLLLLLMVLALAWELSTCDSCCRGKSSSCLWGEAEMRMLPGLGSVRPLPLLLWLALHRLPSSLLCNTPSCSA